MRGAQLQNNSVLEREQKKNALLQSQTIESNKSTTKQLLKVDPTSAKSYSNKESQFQAINQRSFISSSDKTFTV